MVKEDHRLTKVFANPSAANLAVEGFMRAVAVKLENSTQTTPTRKSNIYIGATILWRQTA